MTNLTLVTLMWATRTIDDVRIRLADDERGQTMTEYIGAVLVVAVVVGALFAKKDELVTPLVEGLKSAFGAFNGG